MDSSIGVQQGDPLGPLLFAAGLQLLATAFRAGPAEFSVFYLDDGILAGPTQAVSQALATVEQAAGPLDLSANFAKNEAIVIRRTSPAALAAHLLPALLTTTSGASRS